MKSKDEFKERFTNGEFDELLKSVSSPEDVVKIANDLGYELTVEDVFSPELGEDTLALVAGGKNDTYNYNINDNDIYGNGNTSVDV